MDKNAIKKYAVWARRELISRVSQKALQYGITDKDIVPSHATNVNGVVLSNDEIKQRKALIEQISKKGYEQVMEEVAYTWFNRFSALRFMEVNGYLPSHVRVFTDEENNFKPQILAEAINLELAGLDMDKVYAMKDTNDDEALFKYLIITQCNALSPILPGMFQRISDYTELLFPDNLLRDGSAIQQMIEIIPEEDWKDAVQIIGWLYQYYNSEKKDEVFAALKKNVKITKENIPAATQLFTPDWIVRYMVENSLGRLWVEGHPNDTLKSGWKYYLDEAEQEAEVQANLTEIRKEYAAISPEQIKCIDPCAGSGHILAYMFDVLVQIYEAYGYTARDAVRSIVENNLYGLDIDERAAQLAYFTVMMKARQYDRRFLIRRGEDGHPDVPQPHVHSILESNHINRLHIGYMGGSMDELNRNNAKNQIEVLLDTLLDAKEYGSILNVEVCNWSLLRHFAADVAFNKDQFTFETDGIDKTSTELLALIDLGEMLAQKYDAVITNPPYMGISNASEPLNQYAKKYYPISKYDMSTICMERTLAMCNTTGMMAMINIPVWMSKSSFEDLRFSLLTKHSFVNMLHCGRGIFGSDFGTTAFVIRNKHIDEYAAVFHQLFDEMGAVDSVEQKETWFFEKKGRYVAKQKKFLNIASYPIAYSTSQRLLEVLDKEKPLSDYAYPRKGLTTGDNDTFVRLWFEVDAQKFSMLSSGSKWFPMTKGGDFRRWYGNNEYVVNWENDGFELKNFKDENGKLRSVLRNTQFYLREGISWNDTTATGKIAFRYQPEGYISNASGPCVFADRDLIYLFGLLNSVVSQKLLEILAPNMKFEVGQMALVPIIRKPCDEIEALVRSMVDLVKADWDAFETSWDFARHPLVPSAKAKAEQQTSQFTSSRMEKFGRIEWHYQNWAEECEARFNQLKASEIRLNELFISIYGLENEVSPEVEDRDITVHKADLQRDIKSLISYAVGCMFGRYSLDIDGLAYAGGEWKDQAYITFKADKDGIIPICDDEYFADDIVNRFILFIETVYGSDTLEDNLRFIADALGGKGNSKEIIRNYFLNNFYADHCARYMVTGAGKRPIYWLFDSGKLNGFKALVYMHRYQPDTIARMRTDYVHEQQSRYRTAIADIEQRIASASTGERVKLNKKLKTLQDQATEIQGYEEKIHHLADQYIAIDLDDGVKKNYELFADVLAKIK